MLIVNRNPGAPAGGTGVRYLIGEFDGETFTSEVPDAPPIWADWGKDFYATNTWNDMPAGDGRMSGSAGSATGNTPTRTHRVVAGSAIDSTHPGAAALLRWTASGTKADPRTRDAPHEAFHIENASLAEVNRKIQQARFKADIYEFEAELRPEKADEIGFRLRKSANAETLLGFDALHGEVFVDRTHSGEVSFSKNFPGRHSARLENSVGIKLHVFVDRSSVEVFANDGEHFHLASAFIRLPEVTGSKSTRRAQLEKLCR